MAGSVLTSGPGALVAETWCSGIGAPETARPDLGWCRAFDVDDFARAVFRVRHGYGDDPRGPTYIGGDFTKLAPNLYRRHGWRWPDLVVAGTPCQAFSVAGLRRGLDDERGNLTLEMVRILHELANAARPDGRGGPVLLWENVPGVLSDGSNAFGCLLGGLVGSDTALDPPAGAGWPGAGMAEGPRGRAAWRVVDAQHFGLAQRRARVFLVFDPGERADPAAVLFEPAGVPGDPRPVGTAGEDLAGAFMASSARRRLVGLDEAAAGHLVVGTADGATGDVVPCLTASNLANVGNHQMPMVAFAPELADPVVTNEGGTWTHEGRTFRTRNVVVTAAGDGDGWIVRRLTPRECERLFGFPDDFTAIPFGGRPVAADARRYRALGNSMAVPVVGWILDRLVADMLARAGEEGAA